MEPGREQMLSLFGGGPVVLFIDGTGPEHRGLPPAAQHSVVCLQLAGPADREWLAKADKTLTYTYGAKDGVNETAHLNAQQIFGVAGRVGMQPRIVAASRMPAILGPEPQPTFHRLLMRAGLVPPQPVWNFATQHAELDRLPRGKMDKAETLKHLRETGQPVWLLLRPDAEDLRLATPIAHLPEHNFLVAPETVDLAISAMGVTWKQLTPNGMQPMFIPWLAVSGMQTFDAAQGWFWPMELHPTTQEKLQEDPTVWQRMLEVGVVANTPPPPLPPVILLSPPNRLSPQEALQRLVDHGAGVMLIDPHRSTVQVPPGLRQQPVVAVAVGLPQMSAMVVAEPQGITATMPDADGRPALLRAPWEAVLAITSLGGVAHGAWTWPETASEELKKIMDPLQNQGGVVAFDQPCGPMQANGQPLVRVEFQMRRGQVH